MHPRPLPVTIFGTFNLILHLTCGIVCGPGILFLMLAPTPARDALFEDGMRGNLVYWWLTLINMVIGCVAMLVATAGNVAMLMMKDWGRRVVIGYGWFSIVSSLLGTAVSWYFDGTALASGTLTPQQNNELILGLLTQAGCVVVFGLAYPLAQIYLLGRRSVIEAFQLAAAPPPPFDPNAWSPAYPPPSYPPPYDEQPPLAPYPPQPPPPQPPPDAR